MQWKRSQPDVVEVELWSSRPTPAVQAAPPPPPPPPEVKPEPKPEPKPRAQSRAEARPPPPKKPDIAIKEEKKPPKPEPKKPEPKPRNPNQNPNPSRTEARTQTGAEKAGSRAGAKPTQSAGFQQGTGKRNGAAEAAADASAQQMANAAAAEAEQRAAAGKRGLQDYAAKIRVKVRGNIVLPPNIQGNPEAIFEVKQLPGGEMLNVRLKRSSGNAGLDSAIERAIQKSSPLPKPRRSRTCSSARWKSNTSQLKSRIARIHDEDEHPCPRFSTNSSLLLSLLAATLAHAQLVHRNHRRRRQPDPGGDRQFRR